ncbi:aldehyde dehydrogenase family protein [Caballeronia grimmiae]|uniref:aldehyde dehydrogenase family protein n=1 Tax=Caballeronia grimmiae TaxID=1071679 RepID=UPI0038BA409C
MISSDSIDVRIMAAYSSLPFDDPGFSGSNEVGHEVMRSAAANRVWVTLELGGKSPEVIE